MKTRKTIMRRIVGDNRLGCGHLVRRKFKIPIGTLMVCPQCSKHLIANATTN